MCLVILLKEPNKMVYLSMTCTFNDKQSFFSPFSLSEFTDLFREHSVETENIGCPCSITLFLKLEIRDFSQMMSPKKGQGVDKR